MRNKLLSWLAVLAIGMLSASCLGGGSGSQAESAGGADPQGDTGSPANLDNAYHFTISAAVDGLVADMAYDQLESEWVGDFTVDQEGLINGEGVVVYDAVLFAVDEELCGYSWAEKGEAQYVISGRIHQEGGETFYPLKFLLRDVTRLNLQGPEATCADPSDFYQKMPDQYLTIHRDALLNTVLTHLHQNVGSQIQLEKELEQTSGTVTYQILVSLEPVPLD